MTLNRIVSATVLIGIAAGCNATVCLWDQSALNTSPTSNSFPNSVSPGFNGWITFAVSDVSVPAGGWTIHSVSTYFSSLSWHDGDVTSAVLNVFPKSGALPAGTDDPRGNPIGGGIVVPVLMTGTVIDNQGVNVVEAAGLNIALAAGEYWIGLTPVGPSGPFGADLQWTTTAPYGVGQAARSFDPDTGWFDEGPAFGVPAADGAIKICGIPSPSALAVLGLGGLAVGRRRR